MRTVSKLLTFILALTLLAGLMTVPAFAETGLTGSGVVTTTSLSTLRIDLNSVLIYNDKTLNEAKVTLTGAKIAAIDNGTDSAFEKTTDYAKSVKSGILELTFKSGVSAVSNGSLVANISYKVDGGAEQSKDVLLLYAKVNDTTETWDGEKDETKVDVSTLQSAYDITLRPTAIAQDDKNHAIDIQLHLAYKGDRNFQNAPLSYFRIEPVVSGNTTDFPFKLEYSAYGKTMADIKVVKDSDGKVTDTYFDFPFTVKSDAVNGYYPVTFKLYHLYRNVNLNEATPVETTITTYVEIRNGKKATDSTTPGTVTSDPSTAILLLEGYELSTEEIKAGDTFDITLKIRNTSGKKVTDVKSTLTEAKGTVLPVSGASSFYVEEIGAGETIEKTLTLKAQADAGVLPVEMTLSNAFVHEDMAKNSSDSFILPVTQVVNLSLDAPSYATEIYSGDSTNLTMKLYNKGKSMLYNVSVYLESEGLKADETYYAGNMDSGTTKTYDVMISAADGYEGQLEGEIVVSFEDALGNVSERRSPVSVNVATMDWGEDTWYDDGMMEPVEETKKGLPWWGWAAIGLAVVTTGIGIAVSSVKKHKKKQQEKEDEDEME